MENRVLVETAIIEVSKEIEQLEEKMENQRRRVDGIKGEPRRKLNMKISILKKEELDMRKSIKKLSWEMEAARESRGRLQQRLVEARSRQQGRSRQVKTKESSESTKWE